MSNIQPIALYSAASEKALLAIAVKDKDAYYDIAALVDKSMFYSTANKILWQTIRATYEEKKDLDFIALAERVAASEHKDRVAEDYVFELGRTVIAASAYQTHSEIVKKFFASRTLLSLSSEIKNDIENGKDVIDLVEDAEKGIFKLQEALVTGEQESADLISDNLSCYVDDLEARFSRKGQLLGETTGIEYLDMILKGFEGGSLILIAGRPSMGKSSLLFSMMAHRIRISYERLQRKEEMKMKPMLLFSLEMPKNQVMDRFVSTMGRIPLGNLRDGQLEDEDWANISLPIAAIKEGCGVVVKESGSTPAELCSIARRAYREHGGLSMIGVDYVQLMTVNGMERDRNLMVGTISVALKNLAKELGLPVIALSQLSRDLEKRTDKRPINSDLRDSGSLEQDADVILFPYRPHVYDESEPEDEAEIIIGKQRNGPLGRVPVKWTGQYATYSDCDRRPPTLG